MSQILRPLFDDDKRVSDFFFDEKTKIIYFLKSMGGKQEKISSGIKLPEILKAKREAFRKLKLKQAKAKVRITPLIKDELPLWREVKVAEKLTAATMKNIDQAIKRIEGFWGSMFPHEINRDNIAKWFNWLEEEYPGQLKEKPIKYMRNFSRYLGEKVHNGVPLLPAVPRISDPDYRSVRAARKNKKGRIFTSAEFKKVIEVAASDRDRLIALIMYTMATRITETLTLRMGHEVRGSTKVGWSYHWSHGQNKAGLDGWYEFHASVAKWLSERRGFSSTTHYLFAQKHNPQKPLKSQMIDWKEWRKRANLGWHWTAHTFRHTCLSNLFNDPTLPQVLICKLYRVSMAVALDTYIHVTEEGRLRMRDAIKVAL